MALFTNFITHQIRMDGAYRTFGCLAYFDKINFSLQSHERFRLNEPVPGQTMGIQLTLLRGSWYAFIHNIRLNIIINMKLALIRTIDFDLNSAMCLNIKREYSSMMSQIFSF